MGKKRCYADWKRTASSINQFLPNGHPWRKYPIPKLARTLAKMHREEGLFPGGSYSGGVYGFNLYESTADALKAQAADPAGFNARMEETKSKISGYLQNWVSFAPPRVQENIRRLQTMHPDALSGITVWGAIPTSSLVSGGGTGGLLYDRDRFKVHRQLVNVTLKEASKVKPGQTPVVVVMMGTPASGKTSASRKEISRIKEAAGVEDLAVLNSDTFKTMLPESDGGAGLASVTYHESDAIEGMAYSEAVRRGHHLILDGTGANEDKMNSRVSELISRGYEVHVVTTTLPLEKAVQRAAVRGLVEGRLVDENILASYYEEDGVTSKPLLTHQAVVDRFKDELSSAVVLDNDVPFGTDPVVVDRL